MTHALVLFRTRHLNSDVQVQTLTAPRGKVAGADKAGHVGKVLSTKLSTKPSDIRIYFVSHTCALTRGPTMTTSWLLGGGGQG